MGASLRIFVGSLLLLCLAVSAAAEPVRWRAAFPRAALTHEIPGTDVDVLVTTGDAPGSAAAADALREALSACPTVRRAVRVTPPASLREDAARIAWTRRRAAAEAIFYVQVERDGGESAAVISIFDASGRAAGAFVASPARPMRARIDEAPAAGLSRTALESVDAALASPARPDPHARRGGFGSGFFVGRGLILTAAHVVPGDQADVVLFDGRRLVGRVVERAEHADLALLEVEAASRAALPRPLPLELAPPRVGAFVAAIGHGRGGIWSLNVGIVSNLYPTGRESGSAPPRPASAGSSRRRSRCTPAPRAARCSTTKAAWCRC